MDASALIRAAATEPCQPWPRHVLAPNDWTDMAAALADEPTLALLALWADTAHVHAILYDEATVEPLLASTRIEAGRALYLTAARLRDEIRRLEAMDLGISPVNGAPLPRGRSNAGRAGTSAKAMAKANAAKRKRARDTH